MARVRLSVVIPTFNTAAMTLACCRQVLTADREVELIVADDASTDGTLDLLRAELPEVIVVRLEKNRRFAGAANSGIAASNGDLVLLLNSDARIEAETTEAFRRQFRDDPALGIAGARLLNEDGTPQWSGGPIPTLPWLLVMASGTAGLFPRRRTRGGSGEVGWVSGAAMAFRREVWNAAGPLREHYRFYAQDVDFCARARDFGWHVRVVDDARVTHIGGATMPRDRALLWLDLLTWGRERYGRTWARLALPLVTAAASLRPSQLSAVRQLLVERHEVTGERVDVVASGDEPARRLTDRTRA